MCVGDYGAVTSPQDETGVCKCDIFFGYWGPTCEKLSRVSYAFATMLFVVAIAALFTTFMNVQHMAKTYNSRDKPYILLLRSPGGRTLLFNTLLSLAIFMIGAGLGAQAVHLDKTGTYVRVLLLPNQTAIALSFAATTLSVSMLWLDMAQKAERAKNTVRRETFKPNYKLVLLVMVALSGITITALTYATYGLKNTPPREVCINIASFIAPFFTSVVGASYYFAGRRIGAALAIDSAHIDVQGGAAAARTKEVATIVRHMAEFMWKSSSLLSLLFLGLSLTVPSQRPFYRYQNKLPRYLSGQLLLCTVNCVALRMNWVILDYVRFWDNRRVVNSFSAPFRVPAGAPPLEIGAALNEDELGEISFRGNPNSLSDVEEEPNDSSVFSELSVIADTH